MSSPTKLKIQAYKDATFSSVVGSYEVRVNPGSFTRTYKVHYEQKPAVGSANAPLNFAAMPPSTVNFDLVFDATGAIPNSATDLASEISSFLAVVYDYQGSIHEPYYLKLFWGDLKFNARLTSLTLNYTLFKPDGAPLRAKAQVGFSEFVDPATLAKEEDKQSPDLTHVLTVRDGDTLPLMCQQVYGDGAYYPQVARANGLASFRRLPPGLQVVFPPLK